MATVQAASGAIVVRRASVEFARGESTIVAFRDVSLAIEAGAFVTIIGPSGCGKSTLLRVVADLLPCTSGSVEVYGAPPSRARTERQVGFVFQDATLLPWRSAIDNVDLPLEVGGWATSGRVGRAAFSGEPIIHAWKFLASYFVDTDANIWEVFSPVRADVGKNLLG